MRLFIFPVGVAQLNFNFMSSVAVAVIAGHCLLYRFLSNSDIYSRKLLILRTGPHIIIDVDKQIIFFVFCEFLVMHVYVLLSQSRNKQKSCMRKIHFEMRIITAVNEKPTVSITFNCLILSNILSFGRVLFKTLFINVDQEIKGIHYLNSVFA